VKISMKLLSNKPGASRRTHLHLPIVPNSRPQTALSETAGHSGAFFLLDVQKGSRKWSKLVIFGSENRGLPLITKRIRQDDTNATSIGRTCKDVLFYVASLLQLLIVEKIETSIKL
jgi:hypothetical protein